MVINQQIIITSSTYSTFWSLSATGFVNPSYISGPIESPPTTPSLGFDITGVATLTIAFEGTYSGATVVHQQTEDPLGLVGWFNVQGFSGDGATASTGGSTSGTAYSFPGLGIRHRIQVTALASGTIAVRISTAEDTTVTMGSVATVPATGSVQNVQGTTASGGTGTPNPITIGVQNGATVTAIPTALNANGSSGVGVPAAGVLGKYNATPSAYTDGQYGNLQIDPRGTLLTAGLGPGTQVTASSGNVANASAVATLPGVAAKTTYITGFQLTAGGATTGSDVSVTVVGVISGTMTYTFTFPAGAVVPASPLLVTFPTPIPASAVNTAIVVTLPAGGTGNTNATANAQGFQL